MPALLQGSSQVHNEPVGPFHGLCHSGGPLERHNWGQSFDNMSTGPERTTIVFSSSVLGFPELLLLYFVLELYPVLIPDALETILVLVQIVTWRDLPCVLL